MKRALGTWAGSVQRIPEDRIMEGRGARRDREGARLGEGWVWVECQLTS